MRKILYLLLLGIFLSSSCLATEMGKVQVLGDMQYDSMALIYETTLTETTDHIDITGLDGDTDVEYLLKCRFVNNYNGSVEYVLLLNSTNTNDKGDTALVAIDSAVSAGATSPTTIWSLCTAGAINKVAQSELSMYMKKGYVRSGLSTQTYTISTTTVTRITLFGFSWNDTSTNLTSLLIKGSLLEAGGLGIGTNIKLYARRSHV